MKKKPTETKPAVETKEVDPTVERLDRIIDLLSLIHDKVNSINEKVNRIQDKVPNPFDVSRLIRD